MLSLLDLKTFTSSLQPVTSLEYFNKDGNFHNEGLFSEVIFGAEGTKERRHTFSYIDLNVKIVHPSIYKILKQLDRRVEKFLSTEEHFSLDSNGNLQLDENGVTGYNEFIKMFPKINFRGGGTRGQRDKYIKLLNKAIKNDSVFITKLPIISPDFRPIYYDEHNQLVEDKLNEKYLNIMKRVRNVKNVEKGYLYDLISYGIHQSVMDHNAYILTKINKKDGLIRQNLLGKRTDYSGRSVITPDPKIGLNEIGIPFRMALGLFEPFIIYNLSHLQGQDAEVFKKYMKEYKNVELSIDSVKNLIASVIKGDDVIPDKLNELLWNATKKSMVGRYVMAKRDPALHDLSYRGFKPVLIKGATMLMCPLQVGGFNADFDGDSMAVFHPLSNEAQEEIKTKMMRFVSSLSSDSLTFGVSKEMSLGLYILTKDKKLKNSPVVATKEFLESSKELYMMVKYRNNISTLGRALFNQCLPDDFPYVNKVLTSKSIKQIFQDLVEGYDKEEVIKCVTLIQKLSFKWATIAGSSFTIDDVIIPPKLLDLKKKLKTASILEAGKILDEMEKELLKTLEDTGLGDLAISGASKGTGQIRQMLVAKGLIADAEGNLFPPIAAAYADGLTNEEQFKTSYGNRAGLMDRVITTAETGYTSRKLAYFLNRVEVDPHKKDCGTSRTLNLKLASNNINHLTGRYIVERGKLVLFDRSKYKIGDIIKLRTPIYCISKKICHTCYGDLINRMKSPYVGIYAAQKLGESGSQTSMKNFHTSGEVTLKNKDILKDIIDNDLNNELEL